MQTGTRRKQDGAGASALATASADAGRQSTVTDAASTGDMEAVAAEKAALAHRADELRAALKRSELRRDEAETELETTLQRLKEAVNARMESDTVREEVVAGVADKMGRIAAVHAALVDLVVELKLREAAPMALGRTDSNGAGAEAFRDEVQSRCGDDPLVLVDLLRSSLRVQVRVPLWWCCCAGSQGGLFLPGWQLAYKDDYEQEIEKLIEVADTEHSVRLTELANEADDLRRRAELAEASKQIALRKLDEVRRVEHAAWQLGFSRRCCANRSSVQRILLLANRRWWSSSPRPSLYGCDNSSRRRTGAMLSSNRNWNQIATSARLRSCGSRLRSWNTTCVASIVFNAAVPCG